MKLTDDDGNIARLWRGQQTHCQKRANILIRWSSLIAVATVTILTVAPAAAVTEAAKCEAKKNFIAGKYYYCRLKAEAGAIKREEPVDYSNCLAYFNQKWSAVETDAAGQCPTNGDGAEAEAQIKNDAALISLKLTGARFFDNGDGTVTDVETGLMWEKKDDAGGIHDKDNVYAWSATGTAPDGTAFTTFLGTLNHGTSTDSTVVSGCFAGYCDWRVPTSAELNTILLAPYPCGPSPCIDPVFGPTQPSDYWSVTTFAGNSTQAWLARFEVGGVYLAVKTSSGYVRAVRGGL